MPDLHEASAEILGRIADGRLGSNRDLERLAHLLDNAKLAGAVTFLFLERGTSLDDLEAMSRSRVIVDSASVLASNLELRLDADVPLKPQGRRDLARLKRFLDEALQGVTDTSGTHAAQRAARARRPLIPRPLLI